LCRHISGRLITCT